MELGRRIEELEGSWCEGEVLNLPGWKTIRYKETADDVIVLAEPTTEVALRCGCAAREAEVEKWGYAEPTHVRDVPVRSKRARIYYRPRRVRCLKCKKTGQQQPCGVDEGHALTSRLVDYVGRESFNIFRNFSGVADEVGCSEITVRKIYTARALRLETGRVVEAPRWLALDEVYPRRYGPAHCVITDPEHRRVLDLLLHNGNERKGGGRGPDVSKGIDSITLMRWLLNLRNRDNVEVVTMDMYAPYRSAARRLLKNARIVVDRYHVHNMLNVALKGVLDVVRDRMTHSDQRRLMRRESLVLKNYRRLSDERKVDGGGRELPSEKELFDRWLEDVPDLAAAYGLKRDFSDILQLSDRQKAEGLTDAWLDRACAFVEEFRGKYEKKYRGAWEDPFGNVPGTVADWRASILNYIDHQKLFDIKPTNAFAEFANRQIKKAFKAGNGYTFAVLRAKVVHGGVLVAKRPPHPLDEKRTRTARDRAARKGPRRRRNVSPEANVARLEAARAGQDGAAGLLPKPQSTFGWVERFGSAAPDRLVPSPGGSYLDMLEELETKEKEVARRVRRAPGHDANQIKMF